MGPAWFDIFVCVCKPRIEWDSPSISVQRFLFIGSWQRKRSCQPDMGERGPSVALRALAGPQWGAWACTWPCYPSLRLKCFSSPVAFIKNESWFIINDLTWNQKISTSLSSFGISLIKKCPEIAGWASVCLFVRLLSCCLGSRTEMQKQDSEVDEMLNPFWLFCCVHQTAALFSSIVFLIRNDIHSKWKDKFM